MQQPNEEGLLNMIRSKCPSELTERDVIYTFYHQKVLSFVDDDEWDERGYHQDEGSVNLWLIWWQRWVRKYVKQIHHVKYW